MILSILVFFVFFYVFWFSHCFLGFGGLRCFPDKSLVLVWGLPAQILLNTEPTLQTLVNPTTQSLYIKESRNSPLPKTLFHKEIPFTQRPFHKQSPFTPPFQYGALTHTSKGKSLYKPVCNANPYSKSSKYKNPLENQTKTKKTKNNKTTK